MRYYQIFAGNLAGIGMTAAAAAAVVTVVAMVAVLVLLLLTLAMDAPYSNGYYHMVFRSFFHYYRC